MLGLTWNHPAIDEVLGFGVSALTVLMLLGVAAWFAYSIVKSIARMGRFVRRSSYEALLRDNERLRGSLADAREKNDYLRKLYRITLPPVAENRRRNAA